MQNAKCRIEPLLHSAFAEELNEGCGHRRAQGVRPRPSRQSHPALAQLARLLPGWKMSAARGERGERDADGAVLNAECRMQNAELNRFCILHSAFAEELNEGCGHRRAQGVRPRP